MIYTDLTKKALQLSFTLHQHQRDKSGMPYVFHPFHLAEQMTDEYAVCVALLHDTIEDTAMTAEELLRMGFPREVVDAVAMMTHDPGVPYLEYVRGLRGNPLTRAVKLADLRHNSDLTRLDTVTPADLARAEKYRAAIRILEEELT